MTPAEVEARWGMPFWELVRDIASQGFGRNATARILGVPREAFRKLVQSHPGEVQFRTDAALAAPDCKTWIAAVEAEYGVSLDVLLATEAAAARHTGTSMAAFADDLGVPAHRIYGMCKTLGIHWPRVRRPPAATWRDRVVVWRGREDTLAGHAARAGLLVETVVVRAQRNPDIAPDQLFAPARPRRLQSKRA